MAWTDNMDWSEIIKLGLAYYLNKQGEKQPNFYPVPLSPEDKEWNDRRKALYDAGGSPAMKDVGEAGRQFLSQIPSGPSNFKFMSPLLANQPFAGGVKIPRFDVSKFPGSTPQTPTTPTKPDVHADRPRPDINEPLSNFGGSGNGSSFSPNPDTLRGMTGANPNLNPTDIRTVASAWEQFKQSHPNWAKLTPEAIIAALTAVAGIPGAIVGKILKSILLAGGGQSTQRFQLGDPNQLGNMMNQSPGVNNHQWSNENYRNDDARVNNGITLGNIPTPTGGMQVPRIGDDGSGRFTPTPLPTNDIDRSTFGGNRQGEISDDFFRNLQTPGAPGGIGGVDNSWQTFSAGRKGNMY